MSRQKITLISVFVMLSLLLSFSAALAVADSIVPLNPDHVGATNPGFQEDTCPTPPAGQEGWFGWHFIMPNNNNFLALTVTFEKAGTFTASPFPGNVFVADPDNSHAYIWTPTADTLLGGSALSDGDNNFFNLSHVCPGVSDYEELTVSKTVETSYSRQHFWDIAKSVATQKGYTHEEFPKVWLFIDGSGNEQATWTVDVTYKGYEDSAHNISGEITIENTGTLDALITSIEDVLAGTPIALEGCTADSVDVVLPYTLAVAKTMVCTYSEDVDSKITGTNEATVTTERASYSAFANIVWGEPTSEENKTVTIKDSSDLFGEVELGTTTAPFDAQFTYTKDFAWTDYGADACGDYIYNNTATIVETGQSASATLKVNVQCYIYETAYAKGASAICFIPTFSNWGWTNPISMGEYTWDLWAGAGQCDTSKGTLVGTVTVVYGTNGYVTVTYNVSSPYIVKETHVYAGYTKFPKIGTKYTVAPGAYTNNGPFSGPIYVIAHAVVGLPDPNFGPSSADGLSREIDKGDTISVFMPLISSE